MRTVAIVQARLGSSRLPGKVLADVCGQPMIAHQMDRMLLSESLHGIVIAIPDTRTDDVLEAYCRARGWSVYRGSEQDVLARYLGAAEEYAAEVVVRVTADCPLIDHFVIDAAVLMFGTGKYDFVSNNLMPTFPHGLDVEVMSRGTLAIAADKAETPFDREHVTPWITRASDGGRIFRLGNLPCPVDLSEYRLTVDYPEDLTVVRAIYAKLGNPRHLSDVIGYLAATPQVRKLNARHHRNLAMPTGQA